MLEQQLAIVDTVLGRACWQAGSAAVQGGEGRFACWFWGGGGATGRLEGGGPTAWESCEGLGAGWYGDVVGFVFVCGG